VTAQQFRRRGNLPLILLIAAMLAYFSFSAWYANQRHLAFETGAFDTGVYIQPLWNFLQGKGFAVSIIEDNGPLRWATHVEPILFLIAPLYALWPDPRTLYFVQIAALTLAAAPMFALGVRRLQSRWAALVVVLAYFLMPATQSVTLFDFHAVTLAPLFLLSAIYFLERALAAQGISFWLWPKSGRGTAAQGSNSETTNTAPLQRHINRPTLNYMFAGLFFLLALSTKEDISLIVLMIGLYLLLLRRRWREGGLLAAVGLLWFYVTFQVIIPAYRVGGGHSIYAAWFETLGNTPLDIAMSPITQPDKVLALVFRPDTIPALLMLTLPLALLPWAGLPLFALAAPTLAFVLLSANPTLRQLETWHYAAPILAILMLATIDGLARVRYWLAKLGVRPQFTLKLLSVTLLMTALTYHYFRGYSPLSQLYEPIEVTAHHQLGRQIAATIPPEASVLAQAQLIPAVAHREKLGIWSGPLLPEFDYIFLDLSHRKLPNRFNAHGDLIIGMIYEHDFGAVRYEDGYLLLQNGAERKPLGDELFTFTQFDDLPANAQPFNATFGSDIRLIGARPEIRRLATSETEPQVMLYFDTLQAPTEDYRLFLYLLDDSGAVIGATDYPQPALLWWPTSRWQAGNRQQVRVNTIPWWTGDRAGFGYAIGFSHSDDPWDKAARLPVSQLDPVGSAPLDDDTLLPIAAFHRFGGLVYLK
jgi:uncharacterized membrane protein